MVVVFMRIILYNGFICNDLLWICGVQVTLTKFIYELHNLLILLNLPYNKLLIINILKDTIDIA